ncbi:SLC13 family permease [Dethiobacter alkaliphilus]|uniref:Sodium-dependent dicarboxylate transporter SdcS n=1 Tax=Dethiobacter alkaliphilus AHT 1 TaxID=555088 RepID=C0GDT0_DETAL|nr:SLC13 family permease [Dethiobacter alkaliphilus]EEG78563.1 anion transporter [Dethiobacter alkaliphilus AHT 1]
MSFRSEGLKGFWLYMWHLHRQAKNMMKLNFSAKDQLMLADSDSERKELAQKVHCEIDENEIVPGGDRSPKEGMDVSHDYGPRQRIGLFLGPLLFIIFLVMPTPEGMSVDAQRVLASTAWIATWWITEAIPIPVTSLLPIVLFPLTGAMAVGETTAPYANPNVFLFMGGFMIAVCMEKWNLHCRIALAIINFIGTSPNRLILGFMAATGFLSMWISNTATTMMMLPIGLAVILQVATLVQEQGIEGIDVRKGKFNFGTCLMLCIGYSASIGGVATLIGTPPNIIFAGAAEEMFGVTIGFAQWMAYGMPISIIFMVLAWLYMTRVAYPTKLKEIPGGREVIRKEQAELGIISREEKMVGAVFLFVALAWISRSFVLENYFPMINDALIAILGAIITFLIPVNLKKGEFLNDWHTAVKVPWGILLLFGGGLAIAAGFTNSGLAEWIGMQLSVLEGAQMIWIVLAVVALVIYLTEITSNTATTSMMMPIMAAMAAAMAIHPFALMITAATAASYAFMLPVATPPNAVIFGSGYITIPQMVKAGSWLNILGIAVITLFAYFWLPVIFAF